MLNGIEKREGPFNDGMSTLSDGIDRVKRNDAITQIAEFLAEICGYQHVFTDPHDLCSYEKDQTLDLECPFDILVKPRSPEEIAGILRICNEYDVPVTPRGGGSGVTGGALPVNRGVVISLERLNAIITINDIDGYVIAEAGVITGDLCREVEKKGLFFPVAPSSKDYSFVGGNVAENAGSITSCKYGKTSDYLLNLQVVLPTGEIIWTGANIRKNSTGLNLNQLFAGSEGTLGILTKVVYKLIRKPAFEVFLLAGFSCVQDACNAIIEIKKSVVRPSAVELICNEALNLTAQFLNHPLPLIKEGVKAHILLGLDAMNDFEIDRDAEIITRIVENYSREEIFYADSDNEKERLSKLRFNIGNAMTFNHRKYRDIDACIPISFLYQYIHCVETICRREGVLLVCFGHALDGNLHTMLVLEDHGVDHRLKVHKAAQDIYTCAVELGGVISGEHGIGSIQKQFMPLQFSDEQMRVMKQIKQVLDPKGIMNPGKMI